MTGLTGRHVALAFGGGFGIIIAVNVALAVSAVRTFPGLEVANSYVASQEFDARREEQQALGWTITASYDPGILSISIRDRNGRPAPVQDVTIHAGRPTEARDERSLLLDADGKARIDLAPGLWRLDVAARAPDGTPFSYRMTLSVGR